MLKVEQLASRVAQLKEKACLADVTNPTDCASPSIVSQPSDQASCYADVVSNTETLKSNWVNSREPWKYMREKRENVI